jgi:hypothetical protein
MYRKKKHLLYTLGLINILCVTILVKNISLNFKRVKYFYRIDEMQIDVHIWVRVNIWRYYIFLS